MTTPEVLAIVYGLGSAVVWGTGDFGGGLATRRGNVYSVIVVAQIIGFTLLIALALAFAEQMPPVDALLLGGLAGIFGGLGLAAFYSGLANGRMGVVAPVSAVVTALLPIVVSLVIEGRPSSSRLVGFGVALVAVWLLSRTGGETTIQAHELRLAIAAGVGFGLFFILIDQASENAILWPLAAERVVAICTLTIVGTARRKAHAPARSQFPLIVLAGICDTLGNAFFALATQVGRLDIATVLSSMYPATTVLLAWLFLRERLGRQQWIGVVAALVALALIAF